MSNKKYEVAHPSLYLRVNNKLQKVAKGSLISLDTSQVKKMLASGKIKEVSNKKVVNTGDDKSEEPKINVS